MIISDLILVVIILALMVGIVVLTLYCTNRQDRIRKSKWNAIEENIKKINDQLDSMGGGK